MCFCIVQVEKRSIFFFFAKLSAMPQGYIGGVKVALFILQHCVEKSSQLHTLVNLPPGLEPPGMQWK